MKARSSPTAVSEETRCEGMVPATSKNSLSVAALTATSRAEVVDPLCVTTSMPPTLPVLPPPEKKIRSPPADGITAGSALVSSSFRIRCGLPETAPSFQSPP